MNREIDFYIDIECDNIDDFDCGFQVSQKNETRKNGINKKIPLRRDM